VRVVLGHLPTRKLADARTITAREVVELLNGVVDRRSRVKAKRLHAGVLS
jgi:hypothetical protein